MLDPEVCHAGLRNLNLGSNGLTCESSATVASLMRTNKALTMLQINNNPIGQWGMWRILQALSSNEVLQRLSFDNVRSS